MPDQIIAVSFVTGINECICTYRSFSERYCSQFASCRTHHRDCRHWSYCIFCKCIKQKIIFSKPVSKIEHSYGASQVFLFDLRYDATRLYRKTVYELIVSFFGWLIGLYKHKLLMSCINQLRSPPIPAIQSNTSFSNSHETMIFWI